MDVAADGVFSMDAAGVLRSAVRKDMLSATLTGTVRLHFTTADQRSSCYCYVETVVVRRKRRQFLFSL